MPEEQTPTKQGGKQLVGKPRLRWKDSFAKDTQEMLNIKYGWIKD